MTPGPTAAEEILLAVALSYPGAWSTPRVSAKGRGPIAEEIIRRAKAAGVYVHESRELVGLLMQVDLDRHIPSELYVVVAELLAWLHRIEQDLAAEKGARAREESSP